MTDFYKLIADAKTDNVVVDRRNPPTMLMESELKMLHALARDHFRNEGHIIDAGCFMGGSTCAFATGLLQNPHYQKNPRQNVIHSYDLFEVEPWTIGRYFPATTAPHSDFEPHYRTNIEKYKSLINVRKGDITKEPPFPEMIEILFIDVAKTPDVCDHVNRMFFPCLVPGHSIVIQQDYLYPTYTGWLHPTMEFFSEYFEIIGDTYYNSVAFLYKKQIPQHLLETNVIASSTMSDIYELSKRAQKRFPAGEQRNIIKKARKEYMSILRKQRPASEVRDYMLKRLGLDEWAQRFKKAA